MEVIPRSSSFPERETRKNTVFIENGYVGVFYGIAGSTGSTDRKYDRNRTKPWPDVPDAN